MRDLFLSFSLIFIIHTYVMHWFVTNIVLHIYEWTFISPIQTDVVFYQLFNIPLILHCSLTQAPDAS